MGVFAAAAAVFPFNEALAAAHVSRSLGSILSRAAPSTTRDTNTCCAALEKVIWGPFPNGADHVTFSGA
jgi:hypothetical protein